MFNWRRPILKFYDERIAHNPIPHYTALLSDFHTWPIERRRQVQAERLEELLRHAAQHVPYYRDILRMSGVVQGERIDLSRFPAIPELSRDLMRSEFDRLNSDDISSRACYRYASGGSSGIPVVVLQDREYNDIGRAVIETQYGWAGRKPGEPFATLWGSERDVLEGTLGWRNQLSNFARNQIFLNSWSMGKEQLRLYAEVLLRRHPVMIEAYAESVYELARYLNESKIRVPGIRGVITSAGTLYPFIREEIEQAFGCPTLNRYGSREVGTFAGERLAGAGLEVFNYTHVVEVVDEHGHPCQPGEEGDVLVTCLTNYAMPIIRYRIGDRAVVGAATSTPFASVNRLQTVTGRIMDTFVRSDGTTVPGNFFMHFLGAVHNDGWLKKVQVIQQDYDWIRIKMITAEPPATGSLDEIRRSFQRVMGGNCRVEFDFVDTIPPLPSGKYRYTVSLVSHRETQESTICDSPVIRRKAAS